MWYLYALKVHLKSKFFEISKFSFYVCYFDDVYVLDEMNSDIYHIISIMNSIDLCIEFTFQIKTNNYLFFLDAIIIRGENDFQIIVFRKFFYARLQLHWYSFHLPNQKFAAFSKFHFRVTNTWQILHFVLNLITWKLLILIVIIPQIIHKYYYI